MRGISVLFVILAFLAIVVWVASPVIAQSAAPALPGPRTIVAGKSLAGVALGAPIGIVLQRFGTPSAVIETDRDAVYVFHRFGVNVYAREEVVSAVSTSNSLIKIGDALGPGYRVEDAVTAFGPLYLRGSVEGFQGLRFDEAGIAFGIDRNSVAVILVFRAGQAALVSGLQRGAALAAPLPPPPVLVSGFPFVGGQRAYSMMTNYMSLSGYLRWLVYQSSANWLTVSEATRIVKEQQTSAAEQD